VDAAEKFSNSWVFVSGDKDGRCCCCLSSTC